MNLQKLSERELAKLISQYNGQKGTEKQIDRIVKFYPNKEMMINFLMPRI